MNHNRGTRVKEANSGKRWGLLLAVAILLVAAVAVLWLGRSDAPYRQLCRDGYTGTQEQWLASLVGETVEQNGERAYDMAQALGYTGSHGDWSELVTGVRQETAGKNMYELACGNGYEGTLPQWLDSLAQQPDKLGRSGGAKEKTEYELACDFGYEGTFTEWIVAVAYDRIPD